MAKAAIHNQKAAICLSLRYKIVLQNKILANVGVLINHAQ